MSVLEPPPRVSWTSYFFNPLIRVTKPLLSIFPNPFETPPDEPPKWIDRYVVVLGGEEDRNGTWNRVNSYFETSTFPYQTVAFKMSETTTFQVARYFFSDMERIGKPDQFYINGWKVKAPIGSRAQRKELLASLIRFSKGDLEKASAWTKVWNHRPKMVLCDEVKKNLQSNQEWNPKELLPIIRSDAFQKVITQIDVEKGVLTCALEGKVEWGTDDETNIHPLKLGFTGEMVINQREDTAEFSIRYFSSLEDSVHSEE